MLFKRLTVIILFFMTLVACNSVLAAPGSITYIKSYDLDGHMIIKMLAGGDEVGGVHKSLVNGRGSLSRLDQLVMGGGYFNTSNTSNWTADPDSPMGLEVASNFRSFKNPDHEAEQSAHQVFAVSVKANRGESGSLSQDISAANHVYGDDLQEHYFYIDQYASTSGGTVKRYIDLVDPVSGQYIFEDAKIKGYARVWDSLQAEGAGDLSVTATIYHYNQETESEEEMAVILDGGELFTTSVPTGTTLEQLVFIETIDLEADLYRLTDLAISWDYNSEPPYDPDQTGFYTFIGEVIFPENIIVESKVFILYIVQVTDPEEQAPDRSLSPEFAEPDQFEDLDSASPEELQN